MSKFEDVDLVNYIINQEVTLKEAAEFFDVSVETIKKRMANIKKELRDDSLILNDIKNVADKNLLEGRKKGGQQLNSGKVRAVSMETIRDIAVGMLANNSTIEEASLQFNIPSSTLYEYLELLNCPQYSDIYSDLQVMYDLHRRNSPGIGCMKIEGLQFKYNQLLDEEKNKKNSL